MRIPWIEILICSIKTKLLKFIAHIMSKEAFENSIDTGQFEGKRHIGEQSINTLANLSKSMAQQFLIEIKKEIFTATRTETFGER